MIRVNLIGRRRADAPGMRKEWQGGVWEVASTAMAVAALVAAAGLIVSEAWLLHRTAREVSDARKTVDADRRDQAVAAETLAAEEERRSTLARYVAQLSRWHKTRADLPRMLDTVSRSLPDGLWLTELRQEKEALFLAGRAARPAAVFEFADNLESSERVALPVEVANIDTVGGGRFELHVPAFAAEE
ncbi:MAG: PilN domain-containing protein [Acidobacteria bacterium]|nr:PilN domain-containing protein [Acidobacteriota bacterium]